MKNWLAKNKVVAIIVAAVVVIAGAGTAGYLLTRSPEEASQQYEFNFYESEVKDLGTPDDVGVMLSDCDGPDSWAEFTYGNFTSQEGRYVQGTAGIETAGLVGIGAVPYGIFNDVDASAYEDGSFHISIYIENPQKFTNVVAFELGSGAKWDVDEYQWYVHPSLFKSGWNELYLGMDDVELITGEPDITRLNYFRVYANGSTIGVGDVYLDNLYMTDTPGMSLEPVAGQGEVASTKPGYLLDFDSLTGVSASGSMSFSTAEGEFTEGKGGLVVQNIPDECWFYANIEPFDITKYKGGKFIIPLYISDASHIKDSLICFEMSSSGTWDKQEMFWLIDSSKLKTGWNYVKVLIDSNQAMADTDLKNLNFIRIWGTNCSDDFFFMVDAIEYHPATTITPKDGMFINCDTEDGYQVIVGNNEFSVTTADKEHKQGTGAYKTVGNEIIWWRIVTEDLVNISKFEDGGLKFWLYVDDVTKIKEPIMVEAGSAGVEDVDEYQWSVGGLKNGWNQVALRFDEALVTGEPNLKAMNFFRVFGERSDNVVTILDAVQAANIARKVAEPGMILPCDDYKNIATIYTDDTLKGTTLRVTGEEGEYKEGTGAYKNVGTGQVRYHIIMTNPVDISDCKNGALNLQLYIGKKSDFKSSYFTIEITSAGTSDKNECSWRVYLADLEENSWNDLTLNFSEIEVQNDSVGKMNFSKVNYFRLWTEQMETSKKTTLILDAVKAVEEPLVVEKKEGAILPCDNMKGVIIPSMKDLTGSSVDIDRKDYKEGSASYTITGPSTISGRSTGQILFKATLATPVDISAFKDGGIQFWMYIEDPSAWNGRVAVELNSSGLDDTDELQWYTSGLKKGWQLIQLRFDEIANVLKEGEELTFDYTKAQYFRIYQEDDANGKSGKFKQLKVKIDDVCAVASFPEVTLDPGVILTCDDTNTLTKLYASDGVTITDEQLTKKYDEDAVFKSVGSGPIRYQAVLRNSVDISAYTGCEKMGADHETAKESLLGSLQFDIYIKNVEEFDHGTLSIELGSGGKEDAEEWTWNYTIDELENGWNTVKLNMKNGASGKPKAEAQVDFTKINHFRVSIEGASDIDAKAMMLLDNVHMSDEIVVTKEDIDAAIPGMILSGDHLDNFSVGGHSYSINENTDDIKQGTGAIEIAANAGEPSIFFQAYRGKVFDLSDYAGGGIHAWLYVDDVSKVAGDVIIEISNGNGTGEQMDKNEYQWNVLASSLTSGWNELRLDFADATVTGSPDLNYITFFRIYADKLTADTTFRLDDVRAVEAEGISILNCDNTDTVTVSGVAVTTEEGTFTEGTGAYKDTSGNAKYSITFKTAVDLSGYTTQALKFQLYIDDVDKITSADDGLKVVLKGSGRRDTCTFTVATSTLKDGWNEIELPIANGTTAGKFTETYAVSSMEITLKQASGQKAVTYLDDIQVGAVSAE